MENAGYTEDNGLQLVGIRSISPDSGDQCNGSVRVPDVEFRMSSSINNNHETAIAMREIDLHAESSDAATTLSNQVDIVWRNLSYDIEQNAVTRVYNKLFGPAGSSAKVKSILKPQHGLIQGRTLTALMGPSGAGKTTLLNCITSKIVSGVKGESFIRVPEVHSLKNLRIGFVPQQDHLFIQFTIRESLLFASRMNNPKDFNSGDHTEKVKEILELLNLTSCADQRIFHLSGGQVKRTSIGLEFISSPAMLLLDEPTSGLDSDNAENVIRLLKSLSRDSSTAIITTIHQPSLAILEMFDYIYMLNLNGENIYYGPPNELNDFFVSMGFPRPADRINPADFAMEICNARFGSDKFALMSDIMQKRMEDTKAFQKRDNEVAAASVKKSIETSRLFQFGMLLRRQIESVAIKSHQLLLRTFLSLVMSVCICLLFKEPIGVEDGCWTVGGPANESSCEIADLKSQLFGSTTVTEGGNIQGDFVKRMGNLTTNATYMFLQLMYVMIVHLIGTTVVVPLEIAIVSKEMANSWYTAFPYYLAKCICDTFTIILANTLGYVYIYWVTGQIRVWWRFLSFYIASMLFGQVCDAIGVVIGIWFSFDIMTAIFVATMVTFPVAALSGLMVRLNDIPEHIRPFAYLSPLKYCFEGALASIYGFDRCEGGEETQELFASLLSGSNPIALMQTIYKKFKISLHDMRYFAAVINFDDVTYLDPVWNKINAYMGIDNNSLADVCRDEFENITEANTEYIIQDLPEYQPSFILAFFDVKDESLIIAFYALLSMMVLYRFVGYFALKANIKNRRL